MRYFNVDNVCRAAFYVLDLLMLLYVISLPLACLADKTRVPVLLRPLAHLLETPVSRELEIYLRVWSVDPDIVRCAMYEP